MTPQILAAQAKIQSLKSERLGLRLPDLHVLEQQIQHHAARAIVDPQFKPTLERLIEEKKVAENTWRRNGDINGEIELLQQEITYAEQQERRARIQDAERAYAGLKQEFVVASKSLCRLHQQMLALSARNAQTVPGWQHRSPPRFNVDLLNPEGWMGETSDMLPLPWMNQEKEKAA